MDLVLRYSNQADGAGPIADVMQRVGTGDRTSYGTLPPPSSPRRQPPQSDRLSDEQLRVIFACYRDGVGPRELATRHGVTERTIKYLLKKHGLPQQRPSRKVVPGGRA